MENALNIMFSEDSLSKRVVSLSLLRNSRKPHIQAPKNAAPAFIPINAGFFGGRGGFSLLEVLVVIIIIGILSALAYSSFADIVFTSRAKEAAQTMRSFAERALAEGKRLNKEVEIGLNESDIEYKYTNENNQPVTVKAVLGNGFSNPGPSSLTCGDASSPSPFTNNKVKSQLIIGLSSLEQEDGYFAVCDAKGYCGAAVKVKNKNSFIACIKKAKNDTWEVL